VAQKKLKSWFESLEVETASDWLQLKVSSLAESMFFDQTFTHMHLAGITTSRYKDENNVAKMTKFRPCIDLHAGAVKQIVGGTLTTTSTDLQTNFTSEHGAAFYADLYKKHDLRGGHVIMLGPGNDEASKEALAAWPSGLQVGGGIKDTNAQYWIDAGAEKVGFLKSMTALPSCLRSQTDEVLHIWHAGFACFSCSCSGR
jgi:hypothetical protein